MSIEGKITIKIQRDRTALGSKNTIKVSSSRRTNIADFLKGKSPEEAITILPVIFNICGQAHAHAAKMAFNKQVQGSYLTVLCENAREHILRIFTGWNSDNKTNLSQIHLSEIVGLVSKMKSTIENERTSLNQTGINNIAQQLRDFLQTNVFHIQLNEWLELKTDHQLQSWAQNTNTIAGQFILNTYVKNWQSVGSVKPSFLPEITADKLSNKMHQKGAAKFIAQPHWASSCYETGSLSRNKDHPLISTLAQKHGYGLLLRQIARLVELANIPSQIERHATMENAKIKKLGFGQVETARGRLSHSVIYDKGIIADYKILAPTEWNFHPQGVLTKSLQNLSASAELPDEEIEAMAEMIIEAIDPCVAYDVRLC